MLPAWPAPVDVTILFTEPDGRYRLTPCVAALKREACPDPAPCLVSYSQSCINCGWRHSLKEHFTAGRSRKEDIFQDCEQNTRVHWGSWELSKAECLFLMPFLPSEVKNWWEALEKVHAIAGKCKHIQGGISVPGHVFYQGRWKQSGLESEEWRLDFDKWTGFEKCHGRN